MDFPTGKYKIIYADPPWSYNDRGIRGAAAGHYKTMNLDSIKALPVPEIADDDCVLFLWATYPMVQEALDTIKAWGFTYKTIGFQWIKLNPKALTPFYGLGHWTRGNTEPCLLAVKGKPQRVSKGVSQLIQEPIGKHSAKPPVVREKIIELFGDLPRIELFARDWTDGWDVWGNEVEEDW
jgi:N6-adenosine-specific RNA methylase IME4